MFTLAIHRSVRNVWFTLNLQPVSARNRANVLSVGRRTNFALVQQPGFRSKLAQSKSLHTDIEAEARLVTTNQGNSIHFLTLAGGSCPAEPKETRLSSALPLRRQVGLPAPAEAARVPLRRDATPDAVLSLRAVQSRSLLLIVPALGVG